VSPQSMAAIFAVVCGHVYVLIAKAFSNPATHVFAHYLQANSGIIVFFVSVFLGHFLNPALTVEPASDVPEFLFVGEFLRRPYRFRLCSCRMLYLSVSVSQSSSLLIEIL